VTRAILLTLALAGCGCPEGTPEWRTKTLKAADGVEYVVYNRFGCAFAIQEVKR
jgi:hypothetical protein